MAREKFGSRLGFILVSAGCAIGLGNVWKFPYLCGAYGGAAFILIYLAFLVLLGIPVLVCEFAVGRGSQRSVATAFEALEPKGSAWHRMKGIGVCGCYLLMMFYTMVGGWMLSYCIRSFRGDFVNAAPEAISAAFGGMVGDAPTMIGWTVVICVGCFAVCLLGLRHGIERITKIMMAALLAIMVVLAINSVLLPGAAEGVRFYLVPDFAQMLETGIGNVVFGALSQAFFTLSIGIGAMVIFGSYLGKSRSITGEAVSITILDTFVALTAGFIIIPACFAFGIQPDAGPNLVFITLPNIFAQMAGGRIWGGLFFLFLTFAAVTTIIAVFENIISFDMDRFHWSRKKSVLVSAVAIIVLSMPAVLGFNVLSGIQPLGPGSNLMDLEDFIVSNNLLPLGSLGYVLFCSWRGGWGWENFLAEANTGKGLRFPTGLRLYMGGVIPVVISVIYLKGYYDMFKGKPGFYGWMALALALLAFVLWCGVAKKKK